MEVYLVIAVIIIALALYFRSFKRQKNEMLTVMEKYQAKYCLVCDYMTGINELPQGIPCYLLATEKELLIVTINTPVIKVTLEYSKIRMFQHFDKNYIEKYFIYSEYVPIAVDQNKTITYIITRYSNDDNEVINILFSSGTLPITNALNIDQMKEDNIFDYINARINKQETTIKL